MTLIGRGAAPSSTKYRPRRPASTQWTRETSTPPAASVAATRRPSGLAGRADTHAERRPIRAAAKATFASAPATCTSNAGASSRRSPRRTERRSIASPTVTSCTRRPGTVGPRRLKVRKDGVEDTVLIVHHRDQAPFVEGGARMRDAAADQIPYPHGLFQRQP